ncbi:RagB/SusD family nutrient uptake outer membrane protein [Dyadobacter flavalbus]|uniref:RagB/SusD family nutrient uptake outer membrane protein n=1 Tax=Dyadobacter flavalbus TaxID=2579942 RepID=A0A5M8QU94_9BACT|nr:RagB/SusD family nutrient uptake outer membrane protein [Dyadobacter flavalbus]KAA6438861.1 RagB/SusD family nutrient uptake outer membrane protein [Dyadobacter flavalbus]
MKPFGFIKYVMVALIICSACDRNLDVKPTRELESEYFSDQERMQRGVLAVYAKITDLYGYNANAPRHKLWLLPGDDLMSNNPSQMDNFKGLNGSDADVNFIWNRLYQLNSRANTMLEIIDGNMDIYTNKAMADQNKGEMLFLRSWAFYKLWNWWGKAPVITERVKSLSGIYYNPSQGTEMLDQAIVDLESAATLLPASWPLTESGRVTKDAANGLLVKCYVTKACYNGKNAQDYQKAIAAFERISSSRKLTNHFGENFDYRFENNEESLFEFQASLKTAENPWLDNDFTDAVGTMGAFYKHFENNFTNQGTIVGPTGKMVNVFQRGDPRIAETFIKEASGAFSFNGGYQMVKYINGERGKYAGIANINSINNTRILRLADVKLLAAEAYLQTNQVGKALVQVNDIRARARRSTATGTPAAIPANLSVVTMQNIMDERMRELVGEEGIRWADLKRWHKAGFINLANWKKTDFGMGPQYDDTLWGFDVAAHLLMPIPVAEMDSNPEMLKSGQNPGY